MPKRGTSRRKSKASEDEYIKDSSETVSESCGSVVTEETDDVEDQIRDIVDDLIDFVSIHPDMTMDGMSVNYVCLISRNKKLVFSKTIFKK